MTEPAASLSRSGLGRALIAPAVILLLAAGGLTYVWSHDVLPQFGRAAQVIFSRGIVILAVLALLIWFWRTRLFSRRTKLLTNLALLALVGTAVGSIRKVESTGDNGLVVRFWWEKSAEQKLAEYNREHAPSASTGLQADAPRFTNFLGTNRDGIAGGPALATTWATAPREVWRRPSVGGFAAFVVAGGLVVTIEQRGEEEVVVAYDADTGLERWTRGYPAQFTEPNGDGPRATPTIDEDRVFSLGATGELLALDLATGEQKWRVNILEDAGATNVTWAMSGSPLAEGNLVIVNPGGPDGKGVLAYDRETGRRVWAGGSDKAGYSSPVKAVLHDTPQVLVFDGVGVAGHDLGSGHELWRYPFATFQGINAAQPLPLPSDRVLISAGYGAGTVLLQITRDADGWSASPVWESKNLKCKFTTPVIRDGYVYGLDDGSMTCISLADGERQWRGRRYGHGQILLRGDAIVVMAESGEVALVEATPNRFKEFARRKVLSGDKTWNAPALASNHLYVRNHEEAVCLELPLAPR